MLSREEHDPLVDAQRARLQAEARSIARYLVGAEPPESVIQRYVQANELLLEGASATSGAAEMRFWRRHPASLPLLDAGLAWRHPDSILRTKVYVMAALLETTPELADFFLARPAAIPRLLLTLGCRGAVAAMRCTLGAVLVGWVRWRYEPTV
jgi:hypothetical protein